CALERTILALSARSRIAPVRGTRGAHSLSASDHGVDGVVETGNQHLPHVPQRAHNDAIGCCEPARLTSDGRSAVCGVREGDKLG
ncbi:hypothetical protein LINGRAHAP2_LOCUS34418, partial [Linum grandiflorum]